MFAGETLGAAGGSVQLTPPQTHTSTGNKQLTTLKSNSQDNSDEKDNLSDSSSLKMVAFLRRTVSSIG